MHSYPTRFAHLNRSFFPTATMEVDPDYVPSSSVTASGRRPVTRSMTQSVRNDLSTVYGTQYVARNAALYTTINQILAYSAQRAPQTRVEATHRRPVTRSMTTRTATAPTSRHPMTLRSSRR